MKIRNSFVSNSSSSSFIIINSNNNSGIEEFKRLFDGFVEGNTFRYKTITSEFGWDFDVLDDIQSKFDWMCCLIFLDDLYHNNVLSFLQKYLNKDIQILDISREYGIDHQSITIKNARMMESVSSIEDFMFSDMSKIFTGNDNTDTEWVGVDIYGEDDYTGKLPTLEEEIDD